MPRRGQDLPEEYSEYERALMQAIGARIRLRRSQLGLSQDQLRARVELENVFVSQGQFSRIENGTSLISVTQLIALVKVLDVTYAWLLEGQEG